MTHTFNDLVAKFDIPPAQLQQLETGGVTVQILKTGIKMVKGGEVLATIPVSEATLDAVLTTKTAGALITKSLGDNLKGALDTVLGATLPADSPLHAAVELELQEGGPKDLMVASTLDDEAGSAPPTTDVQTPAASKVGIDALMVQPAVKLAAADKMYQPVHGTDSSSRYFCVAISPTLKIAARYKTSGNLSVRVEGDLASHKKALEATGFSIAGPKHASIHVSCDSQTVAGKALGALIMGLGVEFKTPMPQVALIYGKGH